jgi:hypothetical protein
MQEELQRQREAHNLFRETFSSQTPLNEGNSAIWQHLNSGNAQQPLVRRHKSEIVYFRRRHQKPVRWIAVPQDCEPHLVRYFESEHRFLKI